MKIQIQEILPLVEPTRYKLHLATANEDGEPLDIYLRNPQDWFAWNSHMGSKNHWTREFILSFMYFYHKRDSWLFGGTFRVLERHKEGYKLEPVTHHEKFVGRLVIGCRKGTRGRHFYLEKFLDRMEVQEILPHAFDGEKFCGYQDINHDFMVLENVFVRELADWKAALTQIKGIYIVVDKSSGKGYIGSACGDGGIWSRWASYLTTGHGGNVELDGLIRDKGLSYARSNFKFALLETMPMNTPDTSVVGREQFWKGVLLTRSFGYNSN